MHGLLVGRFQPYHLGHARLTKRAIEDCVNVTIGIGSSEAKTSVRNPFSFEERKQMIEATFPGAIQVVAIPDIHDPPKWVEHVEQIVGPFDRAYGNDDRTMDLFDAAGYQVVDPGLERRDELEGKTVRLQIAEGDRAWRKAVPDPVVALLDAWDAPKRLRMLELRA